MDKGVALVEYVFMISLVVIVIITVIALFGTELAQYYQNIMDQINGLL